MPANGEEVRLREALDTVQSALERYERIIDALSVLAAGQQRRIPIPESLQSIEEGINSVGDPLLSLCHARVVAGWEERMRGQDELAFQAAYEAFVNALVDTAQATAARLYGADMELLSALGTSAASRSAA